MAFIQVGSVVGLWRYPVKSMLGQELERTAIDRRGLVGDRGYALWDVETARVASAKNPKRWSRLLEFQAEYTTEPRASEGLPSVRIATPDGQVISSDDTEIIDTLSHFFQRDIQFLSEVPEAVSLDQFWPDVEGTPRQNDITQLFLPKGTFFDSCPIHLLSTATLTRFQELYPEGVFDSRRFRPNILIEPTDGAEGFVEDAWVENILKIGDEVKLQIDTACPRCVVTTLAQPDLQEDLSILRATAKHNGLIAGIRASVLQTGIIHCGDPIYCELGS